MTGVISDSHGLNGNCLKFDPMTAYPNRSLMQDSQPQSCSDSNSLLTCSLKDSDSFDCESQNEFTNGACGKKTDAELMEEVAICLARVREEVASPRYKELLRKCENVLSETSVKEPCSNIPSEQTRQDDFVLVERPEVLPMTGTGNNRTTDPPSTKSNPFKIFFRNFKEKKNYKFLSRSLSTLTHGPVPRLSRSCDHWRYGNEGSFVHPQVDVCPEESCAVLRVWEVCESCRQPVDESLY